MILWVNAGAYGGCSPDSPRGGRAYACAQAPVRAGLGVCAHGCVQVYVWEPGPVVLGASC